MVTISEETVNNVGQN